MSVDKCVFTKDESSFTFLPNEVLQNLHNMEALGAWSYFSSLPPNWEFYKDTLRKHMLIGRDKLDKILNILEDHNLIKITQVRNGHGQFSYWGIHVYDGKNFIKEPSINKDLTPLTENPLTVDLSPFTENQLLVNSTYIINNNKTNNANEVINNKNSCANEKKLSDDLFDKMWDQYPKKKKKIDAKNIWDRKKLYKKSELICNDIKNRLENDPQWQEMQFIPNPDTYLRKDRWNDDITPISKPIKSNYQQQYQSKSPLAGVTSQSTSWRPREKINVAPMPESLRRFSRAIGNKPRSNTNV